MGWRMGVRAEPRLTGGWLMPRRLAYGSHLAGGWLAPARVAAVSPFASHETVSTRFGATCIRVGRQLAAQAKCHHVRVIGVPPRPGHLGFEPKRLVRASMAKNS